MSMFMTNIGAVIQTTFLPRAVKCNNSHRHCYSNIRSHCTKIPICNRGAGIVFFINAKIWQKYALFNDEYFLLWCQLLRAIFKITFANCYLVIQFERHILNCTKIFLARKSCFKSVRPNGLIIFLNHAICNSDNTCPIALKFTIVWFK